MLSLTELVGWQATVCAAPTTGFTEAERLDRGVEEEGTDTVGVGVGADVAAADVREAEEGAEALRDSW